MNNSESKTIVPILETIVKVLAGAEEAGRPSSAQQHSTKVTALAAFQQITQPYLPGLAATSNSMIVADSDSVSVTGSQGGTSASTKRRKVGSVKHVS